MGSEWRRLAVCVVAVACSAKHLTSSSDDGARGAGEASGSSGAAATQSAGGARAGGTTHGGAGRASVGGAGTAGRGGSLSEAGVGSEGGVQSEGGIAGQRVLVRHLECETPTELSGGYVHCDNGFVHRPAPGICPSRVVHPSDGGAGGEGGSPFVVMQDCDRDEQCGRNPLAFCDSTYWLCVDPPVSFCSRGCVQDGDCDSGQICVCGNALLAGTAPIGQCVKASCTRDADCAPGYLCVSSPGDSWVPSFSCQSPSDECGGDKDCVETGEAGAGPWGWGCSSVNGRRICDVPRCNF